MKRKEKNGNRAYKVITDKIVALLEQGTIPWKKPWINGPAARSYRGYEYRGINRMLLSTIAGLNGLKGAWITYRQARQLGGSVKKGAKGVPVVFWKWVKRSDRNDKIHTHAPTHECDKNRRNTEYKTENDSEKSRMYPLCRYYTVFSICQTEGVLKPSWLSNLEAPRDYFESIKAAEEIWDGYPARPILAHSAPANFAGTIQTMGDIAAYFPWKDTILMPQREQFRSPEDYYSTLFHEMTHSTGHEDRLNRFKSCVMGRHGVSGTRSAVVFGSDSYSREELVAEMGSAFLAAEAGIQNEMLIENSAAYLQSWIKVLRADPRMAVVAAAQAQKSTDLILGRKAYDNEGIGT